VPAGEVDIGTKDLAGLVHAARAAASARGV